MLTVMLLGMILGLSVATRFLLLPEHKMFSALVQLVLSSGLFAVCLYQLIHGSSSWWNLVSVVLAILMIGLAWAGIVENRNKVAATPTQKS